MKRHLFLTVLLMALYPAVQAQLGYSSNTLTDGNGNPILSKKASPGETTYLFNKNYLEGLLYIEGNSKPVSGTKYKLNLQDNRLFFQDLAGHEMEVTSPVSRLEFTGLGPGGASVVFVKGMPPIERLTGDSFYQLLVDGKAKLLMNTQFSEVEYREFNSASTARRTDKLIGYYGFKDNRFAKLVKPEEVLLLLGDKAKQVSDYIKQENLKLKKQSDLEKLFRYYNSL